jgi:hypothetical protein
MNTPLTEQQRELLSAWLDGEVTDAERATVETLLQREDAKQYVESLRATATLVATHAPVRAPVGLSGRVLSMLEDEFKPKALGPGSEPFTTIPTLSWRAPLYAAAAAILVALGIMFGPALTSPGTSTSVARTPLDNLSGEVDGLNEKPGPEPAVEDMMTLDAATEKGARPAEDSPAEDPAHFGPEAEGGDSWGKRDANKSAAELEKVRKESHAELKNEPEKDSRASRNGAPDRGTNEADKPRDQVEETDGEEGAATGKAGATGGGTAPNGKKSESERAESRGDDSGGGGGATKKDKLSAPRLPSEPSLGATDDKGNSDEEMTIDISAANSIAAQTDVLWVSSLYGDAELTDENVDFESVAVDIDAAKLPELMAALRRLAKDQGYGEVDGDADETQLLDRAREGGQGIKGYLPADEADAPKTESAKPAQPAPQPGQAEPAEKVRVIIRLK